MHQNKGKSIAQCLADRTDYAKNPEKTNNEELISAYECDPHTSDAEFLFSKRQYKMFTGREQNRDVIAYQIRQSFKPGEVTPEQANEIGYELAQRLLKGKHAFIVCTHVDKEHIHSHIIFNSTSLDCKRKFRDFLGSGRAVARLSDIMEMQTLTPAMLHELIDKIEVHHITGTGKSRVQQIVIHYRFVGCVEIPDAPQAKHTLDTRQGVSVTYQAIAV